MRDQEKTAETIVGRTRTNMIQRGPMEGLVLIDGRPNMERMDMPSISFESILAVQRCLGDDSNSENES